MKDVQNQHDPRRIEIQKVGVKNVKYPIVVLDKNNQTQTTVATINMYADLPHNFKGTHMSRFIDVVNEYYVDISMHNFLEMLGKVRAFLDARRAYAEVIFPYFIEKQAPVSRERSMMEYICEYMGEVSDQYEHFYVGIQVPIATVCPCSQEISDIGAHNQRGIVRLKLMFEKFFWIEDVISIVEQSGSSERMRSTSPSRPSNALASSKTWCGRLPRSSRKPGTSAGSAWRRRTSKASTITAPMPTWNGVR